MMGTRQRSASLPSLSNISVAGSAVPFSPQVKLLGLTLDNSLSLNKHVASASNSCFFQLRALRHIRHTLTDDAETTIASSLVGSRLDYANAILVGTSSKNINRLQHIQNTLARIVMKVPPDQTRNVSTKHPFSTLHWLPVRRRIDFKIAVLTYKLLPTGHPSCLACKITSYVSERRLRSSESGTLTVPRIKTVIGSLAFRSAAPSIWNLIPVDIRTAPSLESFRVKLKTHYFQLAFCYLRLNHASDSPIWLTFAASK